MCGGGGSAPDEPAALPEAPTAAPTPEQSAGGSFREEVQKKRGETAGGTLLTGPRGLETTASTQQKTLLGS